MNKTIEYYNNRAGMYAEETMHLDMEDIRSRFLSFIPDGGKILDAGCGSGRDTIAFLNKGYDVDAIDASQVMCEIASENTGIEVKCVRFEELTGEPVYDGIWACASLLHVKREALESVLDNLHGLLKSGGVIYASFKYGDTERIKDDRYFNDITETLAEEYFAKAFQVVEIFINSDHRSDRPGENWVNIIARK